MGKTLNLKSFRLCYSFKLWQVKVVTISLPDRADDAHYSYEQKAIVYWFKSKKIKVELPRHEQGKELFRTPMYNRDLKDYNKNRVIKVELLKSFSWKNLLNKLFPCR